MDHTPVDPGTVVAAAWQVLLAHHPTQAGRSSRCCVCGQWWTVLHPCLPARSAYTVVALHQAGVVDVHGQVRRGQVST